MKTRTYKIQLVTTKAIMMAAVLSMFAENKTKFLGLFCLAFFARGVTGNIALKLRNTAILRCNKDDLVKIRICKFLFKLTGGVTSTIINQLLLKECLNNFLNQVINESIRQPLYWFIVDYFIIDMWLNAGKIITVWGDAIGIPFGDKELAKFPGRPYSLEQALFIKGVLHFAEKYLVDHKYHEMIFYIRFIVVNEMLKYFYTSKKTNEEFLSSFKGKICVNTIGALLYAAHIEYFPYSEYLASEIFHWCGDLYKPISTITALVCYRHIGHLIYESFNMFFSCNVGKGLFIREGNNPAPLGQY